MKAFKAASKQPDLSKLSYPVLASIKYDGIRCLAVNGVAMSREMKPIPNRFIQEYFTLHNLHGLDGELMIAGKDFNEIQSQVMSINTRPNFSFLVFDYFESTAPFVERLALAEESVVSGSSYRLDLVPHTICDTKDRLEELYETALQDGYEGLVLRDPRGKYKQGRGTVKEGAYLKLKPVDDAEATIIGFEELFHNLDTSTKKQENMVASGTLGALVVEAEGEIFKIGSGFDSNQRYEYWLTKDKLIGKVVSFKFQGKSKYGIPRFPVFKGFRND